MSDHKSFLKWAGGKIKLLPRLRELGIEEGDRFIEPFVGSGVVALNMPHKDIIISDVNDGLMALWMNLRTYGFIDVCRQHFEPVKNGEENYYLLRALFNQYVKAKPTSYATGALFLYLNKHGFNGLCRTNAKGEFNVPYGHRKIAPGFPEKELLHAIEVSKKMQIWKHGFEDTFKMVKKGDTIFNDPPYVPLSKTASFVDYGKDGFSMDDHHKLSQASLQASKMGATVFITNHDTPYTRDLYKNATYIESVNMARNISCKGNSRNPVKELVVIYK